MVNATVRVWNGKLLVEYKDKTGLDTSFVVESLEDIKDVIKELKLNGFDKNII